MRNRMLQRRIAPCVILAVLLTAASGCLVARVVQLDVKWDIPNDLTDKGFRYVKRGVEARYRVDGIVPAKLDRVQLMAKMNVTQGAYSRFWKAAGGLRDNQRLVNVVVESSFVTLTGFSASSFLVVHMYADVVELSSAQTSLSSSEHHPAKAQLIRRIASSIRNAIALQQGG